MAENTQLAEQKKKELGPVGRIKEMLSMEKTKQRFAEVLGKKAPQFMASIVNVVSGSEQLKLCDPSSIMAAAFVAASFDLPIDSNLGFAALVPYKKSFKDKNGNWAKKDLAQFQMMYKGFIQLAIRSGKYEKMNCSEVYEDELRSYNPITGECEFVTDFSKTHQRENGEQDKIVGYYGWFRLTTGFTKELYMTRNEVTNHAKKYSMSYRYDLNDNKTSSKWSTDFDAMAKKTVIKMLLSKWGILSVEMQNAITDDQKVMDEDGNGDYSDNQPDIIQTEDPFKEIPDNAADDTADDPFQMEELDITNM